MQLKLYTRKEAQSGEITYKDEEKGYICKTQSFSWGLTAITFIITTAAICMTCKVLHFLLKAESKQADVNRAVFFSMGFIAFLANIIYVGFLVHAVWIYITVYTQFDETYSVTDANTILSHMIVKVSELGVGIFVLGIGGTTSCCCSNYLPLPKESRSDSAKKCYSSYASKCVYFLYFANFFYFAYMVGLNVLPTFVLVLIAPIETLSVLAFFVSLLSSCVMVVAIFILRSEIHTSKKSIKERNETELCACGKRCEIICSASIYFLALISFVLLEVVFLIILAATTHSNASHLATVIVSVGNTILIILGGYFTQQRLSKENTQKCDVESGTVINGNENGKATEENLTNGTPAIEGSSATGENEIPATEENRTPATEENGTPATEENGTPATEENEISATEENGTPATEENGTPATEENEISATEENGTPATEENGEDDEATALFGGKNKKKCHYKKYS